jgi:zinc protease
VRSPSARARAPAVEPAPPFLPPRFRRESLAGGLELTLAPRHGAPLVEASLLLPAGGERNPLDRAGLASLAAALIDEGTRRRSGLELASAIERLGISLSCGADWDCARLSVASLAAELDDALEALAEVAREPTFPAAEVERLRAQTLTEIHRLPDHPARLAGRALTAALYPGSPFAELLQGNAASVAAIGRDDLVAFHSAHYLAAPARIVVGGAFDEDAVRRTVERLFGSFAAASLDPAPAPPATRGERVVQLVDLPRAAQTELRVGHVGVPRAHPDRARLGLMNALLGGKFSSRLNLNLRERHGFTYGVSSRFVDRKGPGPFVVATAVATDVAGSAVGEILAELQRLRDEPVAESELAESRSYLLGVYPYTFQTVAGHVARLADLALHELPVDHLERSLEQIAGLTVDDVGRLAREHLRPREAVIVAVGPADRLAPQLERFGPVSVVDAI